MKKSYKKLKSLNFVQMIQDYKPEHLKSDISSGLSVAAVSLPQDMAYALIAGLNPIYGLYTFIVSTIVATFMGVSSYMIVGPTNIIAVTIASSLNSLGFVNQGNYLKYALMLTFLVGIIQIAMASLKLGNLVNYVSHAVIMGLTTGVALIIGTSQLSKLLGVDASSGNVINTIYGVIKQLPETNYYALGMGLITILVIILGKKFIPQLPSYLVSIIISVILVYTFNLGGKMAIVGSIESSVPTFNMIDFEFGAMRQLLSSALSIAILGFIQVLSIVKAMEKKTRQEAQLNREFIGQGVINVICSFFSGFAITGSFTKSFANYEAGAKSRFSEMIAGISELIFIVLFSSIVSLIPIPSLAAIVIMVAYYMFDKDEIIQSFKTTKFDAMVFSATFITTILTPRLDYAIYFGVLVSFILVLKNTSDVNFSHISYNENGDEEFTKKDLDNVKEDECIVINVSGVLHFNASESLKEELNDSFKKEQIYVIRLRDAHEIDLTAIQELDKFVDRVKENGGSVMLCGLDDNIRSALEEYGLVEKVDKENIFMEKDDIFHSTKNAIMEAEKKNHSCNC